MKNTNIKQVTTLTVDFIMHENLHKYFENIKKLDFYRAMHFSAYARSWDRMSAVRPSVRL